MESELRALNEPEDDHKMESAAVDVSHGDLGSNMMLNRTECGVKNAKQAVIISDVDEAKWQPEFD